MIWASFSLSLPRSGWKSTSMPRSLKIWTAAGERASEMRTRGAVMTVPRDAGSGGQVQLGPGLGVGPVEPGKESLDVGRLDRRAAPDAQARRGIAIGRDVV